MFEFSVCDLLKKGIYIYIYDMIIYAYMYMNTVSLY